MRILLVEMQYKKIKAYTVIRECLDFQDVFLNVFDYIKS